MEPDVDILDQDIETQNTNTDDLDGGLDDNLDNDNSDDQGKESQEVTPEDEEKALQEQLDAITSMDDDAFFEYMNSGKLPGTEKVAPKEKEVTTDEDKGPVDDKTQQYKNGFTIIL